jgi:hypothetical protein
MEANESDRAMRRKMRLDGLPVEVDGLDDWLKMAKPLIGRVI